MKTLQIPRFLFLFLISSFLLIKTNAQELDSLKQIWHSTEEGDSSRRLACIHIIRAYNNLDLDSSLVYAQALVHFAQDKQWESTVGMAMSALGNIYERKGDILQAIASMEESIHIRTQLGEEAKLGGVYINLGKAYQRNGRHVNAIQSFNKGIMLSREAGREQFLGNGLTNLGILYYEQGEYEQAQTYYQEALAIFQQLGDQSGIADTYINLATIKKEQNKAEEAIDLFKKGLNSHREIGDSLNIGLDYYNIGVVYMDLLNNTSQSKLYFTSAKNKSLQTGFTENVVFSILGIAQSLYMEDQVKAAIEQAEAARDTAQQAGLVPTAMLSFELLADLYQANKQSGKALDSYRLYMALKDSISNEASQKEQIQQTYRYAYEKQAFSDSLSYIQERATIELSHQQDLAKRNYVLFGGLALSLFGFLFFRYRSQIRSRERELELQQERKRKEQLAELDALKSRFFANISHEFRTPLTLILGQADDLQHRIDDPALDGKFEMLNRNSRRLLQLINQVLDLSKLESGKLNIQKLPLNLIPFLKNMIFSFESLTGQKKITLGFEGDSEEIIALVDPEKLERVFFNLISNAVKFTPEHGAVKMHVLQQENKVRIGIRDTGVGISRDQLGNIFDRFYQADSNERSPSPGTGIGLALAKELVELHAGSLSVESDIGQGSTFWVELPIEVESLGNLSNYSPQLEPAEAPIPILIDNTQAAPKATGERVLIVEDNSDVRSYLDETLKGFGYEVIQAEDGLIGLEQAAKHQPELIISDVMMPRMDGLSFAKAIRENAKSSHIPLILLTAKASEESKITGLETGVDDYLTKPFKAKELQVRIKNLIEQRKRLQQQFSTSLSIKPKEVSAVPMDQAFLQTITETIEANIGNGQFGVDVLSEAVNMSVQHLNRKLNALIGQSAGKLIRSMRLQRAAAFLEKKSGTISDISYKLGFSDPAAFARAFKRQFGVSPSHYNQQQM